MNGSVSTSSHGGEKLDRAIAGHARRHDLDALRGVAMLLGIALHAACAYSRMPWPVIDVSSSLAYTLFTVAVHGFWMPLFSR